MRILIAEDERITRATLTRQLQNWGHEVAATEDGQQAWEKFESGEFDIIITDWEMPKLSGVELVRKIRSVPRSVYCYIIILTSRSDKSDIVAGIEAGADDFVSKPFDREELRVRLLAGERIIMLERELHKQNAALKDANERIHTGLEAAARVQQSMLPRKNIETPRVSTAWNYIPTDELAGDAIGLHLIDDRYLVAYVLDVSGHGVPAALLSVSAMHSLEPVHKEVSLLRTSANGGDLGSVQPPARVAAELNRRFRAGENDGRYLTMILCVLDTVNGKLHVTSAGHPAPLLLRKGEVISLPDVGGFPIAIVDDAEYDEGCIELQPQDRVCLFSDGIVEQTDASDDEQFGTPRIAELLMGSRSASATDAAKGVVAALGKWSGGRAFTDDVSLVILDWLGEPQH
jgi:sigma-B regulation protein RsbU (phosphoserine phosphatase)